MFDVYYINLEHRVDRLKEIENELHGISVFRRLHRIEGIYNRELGILGCCQSHIKALEQIILSEMDDESLHIIFEDDFSFNYDKITVSEFLKNIEMKMTFDKNMHVFCLGVNILESTALDETMSFNEYTFQFIHIQKSQAHSGYIIKKRFAPILLKNYRESEAMIIQSNFSNHPYCFDVYVQHLQTYWRWYSSNPKIGKQRPNYSDICKENVNHEC